MAKYFNGKNTKGLQGQGGYFFKRIKLSLSLDLPNKTLNAERERERERL